MNEGPIVAGGLVWVVCAACWLWRGEKRLWSPLLLYLVFHLLSFVIRPWSIYASGDQSFLRGWIGIWPTAADHDQAIWQATIGLVALTMGALVGEARARQAPAPTRARPFDPLVASWVGLAFVALSLVSLFVFGRTPWSAGRSSGVLVEGGAGSSSVSSSSAYFTNFYLVSVGTFLVLIAVFGLRRGHVAVLALFFTLMAYQGSARTTYLLGTFAIVAVATARAGRRRPSTRALIVLLVVFLAFVSGKSWLSDLLAGDRAAATAAAVSNQGALFDADGELFLNYDFLVATTYLVPRSVDHSTLRLYGRPLYGWIPRALWPGKPVFDFAVAYMGQRVPEVTLIGLTVTLVGESYLSFGTPGVVVIMVAFGLAAGYVFRRGLRYPTNSLEFILSLAACVSLFQVYRDGLVSLTQYGLFYGGPALVIWIGGLLVGRSHRVALDPTPDRAPSPACTPRRAPAPRQPAGSPPGARRLGAPR